MFYVNLKKLLNTFFFHCLFVAASVIVLLAISTSCSHKKEYPRPLLFLSERQMIDILTDVHVIEASMNFRRNLGQSMDDRKAVFFDSLFKIYGITPEILEHNMRYYNENPEQMDNIYQAVIEKLTALQSAIRVEDEVEEQ